MSYIYRAYCGKCGVTRKESDERRWLSHFFLGSRCNNCGEYKGEWTHRGEIEWRVEYGHWARKTEFKVLQPKTWFSGFEWIEFKEDTL